MISNNLKENILLGGIIMGIKERLKKIEQDYYNRNYVESLNGIEVYLSEKNNGIYDLLLHIYINCQIQLGLFESAIKNLELLEKLYPGYYNDLKLASRYISCGRVDKLDEILARGKFTDGNYFHLAEDCFLKGQHIKAEELFMKCLFVSKDEFLKKIVRDYLRKIRLYREDKSIFVETSYFSFKLAGKKLEPGHVIYVSGLSNEYKENTASTDPKKGRRPYMVWKVVDNKIYVFNMSTQVNYQKDIVLRKENYPNNNFDTVVRDELFCIDDGDVILVADKLNPQDYEETIRNIYVGYSVSENIPKSSVKFFMDTITSEIDVRKNDVIVIYDFILKDSRQYFVLDIDVHKKKFKVIEVKKDENHQLKVVGTKTNNIDMNTPILKCIRLGDSKADKLMEQVPVNFKNDSMIGSIVIVGNKKLEILIEENDYYVCIDRTFGFSSSFIMVELISKKISLSVAEQLSQEVYQSHLYSLRDYLKRNPDIIKRKRKLL